MDPGGTGGGASLGWASLGIEGQTLARTAETCFCQNTKVEKEIDYMSHWGYGNLISEKPISVITYIQR